MSNPVVYNPDYLARTLYYSYCESLGKSPKQAEWEWYNWVEGWMPKEKWKEVAERFAATLHSDQFDWSIHS